MVSTETSLASGKILVDSQGDICVIRINRPERKNALDNEAALGLAQALREFDRDDSKAVAVLTGSGDSFCAGADLKALGSGQMYQAWAGHPDGPCHQHLSKPLIAAVSGYACAGGMGLALRCDLRVVDASARFAVLSRRWGVPMSDGTTVRLPRLIGAGRALDMLMTAREVDADQAIQIGLADRKASDGDVVSTAIELAQQIASFPATAMLSDRQSLYAGLDLPLAEALQLETQISDEARRTTATQGAQAFADGKGRHGSLTD
jgi:enoyl-CoA hydratase